MTNTVDAVCAFAKNFYFSFIYNLERTFNLLGEYGVMGPHQEVKDPRDTSAQIFLSGDCVCTLAAVFTAMTNMVDAVCAFAKNFYFSFIYNLERTFNLLGEYGGMGKRHEVTDTRDLSTQIFYGILSAPFVAVFGAFSNTVDAVYSFAKNFYFFIYNLERTFNLLGDYGVMGKLACEVTDTRDLSTQIFYGIVSAPLVAVFAAVSNTVDKVCGFAKNFYFSFIYNLERTFNLLGEYGVMGPTS